MTNGDQTQIRSAADLKSIADPTQLDYEPTRPPAQSLGDKAARGYLWAATQTIGIKVVSLLSQVILARILLREDFGKVALAYTFIAFISLLQHAGIRESLIRRYEHYRRWANPAFWMSLALGLVAAMLMVIAARVARVLYQDPDLSGLIYVVAMSMPFVAVSGVSMAKLQAQMRFRALAAIGVMDAVGAATLSIIFALAGMGAYSFVLPHPILAVARLTWLSYLARPPLRWNPQFRRWRFLFAEGGLILVALALMTMISQGDYVILKLISQSTEEVGIYYFAYVLSVQTVVMISTSLGNVLLPVLSELQHDPQRQAKAYFRVARLLAVISVPACLLQSLLAGPLVRAVFSAKWIPSIPLIQILSIAMAVRMISASAHSIIKAQNRLRAYALFAAVYAAGFIAIVCFTTSMGGATGTAWGVMICVIVFENAFLYITMVPGRGTMMDVLKVYGAPSLVSVVAIGAAAGATYVIPAMPARDWIVMVSACAVTAAVYLPLIRKFAPDQWFELTARARPIGSRAKAMIGW